MKNKEIKSKRSDFIKAIPYICFMYRILAVLIEEPTDILIIQILDVLLELYMRF